MAKRKSESPIKTPIDTIVTSSVDDFDITDEAPAKPQGRAPRVNKLDDGARLDDAGKSALPIAAPAQAEEPVDTVNPDDRKLSKKNRELLTIWGTHFGDQADITISTLADRSKAKFGKRAVVIGEELKNLIIGIPCPLAFEYIVAQDVLPLGLLLHLIGQRMTCKSSLLYEIMRWFTLADGWSNLYEHESKFSPDLLQSIHTTRSSDMQALWGDNTLDQARVMISRCQSVEDWQQQLLFGMEEYKKMFDGTKEKPGPGRVIPVCFGVDSVVGKPSAEAQKAIMDEGVGQRRFPHEALIINDYIKTISGVASNMPYTLICNNHLKMGKDDQGREQRRTGGGATVGFQTTLEIETTIFKQQYKCKDWEGTGVRLKCWKNSIGPTYRSIKTRHLWRDSRDPVTRKWRSDIWWDWHWSTISLFVTLKEDNPRHYAALRDVLHLETPSVADVENTAWSKTLGMKADDARPWAEVGRMITSDTKLLREIRGALGIAHRSILSSDYKQMLKDQAKELP